MIHKIKDIIYILKNSNLIVRATFIALVILVLGYIKATCFAYTIEEFEIYIKQIYLETPYNNNAGENGYYYQYILNFLNSSVYAQYKDNIPFDTYNYCWVRISSNDQISIFLFNDYNNISINNNGRIITSDNINGYMIRFNCNRNGYIFTYDNTYTPYTFTKDIPNYFGVVPGQDLFTILLSNINIINQYNYNIYGLKYTANIWTPYKTTYIETNKQHRLGERYNRSILL